MAKTTFFQGFFLATCTVVGLGFTQVLPILSQTNRIPKPLNTPVQLRIDPKRILGFSDLRLRALQLKKPVRVIARLSQTAVTGSTPSETPLPAALDAPLPQINSAQSRIINRFRTLGVTQSNGIEGIPLVVLEVNADQLDQMIANGEVAEVFEDRLSDTTLDTSTPLIRAPQSWNRGARGQGQTIAILDTGVQRNHPFLSPRVVEEACYSTNSPGNNATSLCPGGVESSTAPGSAAPCVGNPSCEHGTHVAGIAAGRGNNFNGVAPDASILAIQVFSRFTDSPGNTPCTNAGRSSPCLLTYDSDQIRGLTRVRDRTAARSIVAANMSLGGGRNNAACNNDPRKAVIDQLLSRQVATVISAGNNGWRDSVGAPGCITSAITVGATTDSDTVASYSNVSNLVDLFAPGGRGNGDGGTRINSSISPNGFGEKSGTSMAAPHVAGAFAVIRSLAPGATVSQILTALQTTGVSIAVPGTNPALTRRRINVEAALATFVNRPANPGTFRTGLITLNQTFTVDFDGGMTAAGNASDLWFQAVTANELYLSPVNGAGMWVGDRSNRGYEGCVNGAYSPSRVSLTNAPVGSYICMRTNQGRISQFRVNTISAGSPKQLQIGFTTWNQ